MEEEGEEQSRLFKSRVFFGFCIIAAKLLSNLAYSRSKFLKFDPELKGKLEEVFLSKFSLSL